MINSLSFKRKCLKSPENGLFREGMKKPAAPLDGAGKNLVLKKKQLNLNARAKIVIF